MIKDTISIILMMPDSSEKKRIVMGFKPLSDQYIITEKNDFSELNDPSKADMLIVDAELITPTELLSMEINIPIIMICMPDQLNLEIQYIQNGAAGIIIKEQDNIQTIIRNICYIYEKHKIDCKLRSQLKLYQWQHDIDKEKLEQVSEYSFHAKHDEKIFRQLKQSFLENINHELRTPMNSIIGMTNLLMNTSLDDKQKKYLNILSGSADTLLNYIYQLLDFSGLDFLQPSETIREFNIRHVIERIAHDYSVAAFEKEIQVLCFIPPKMHCHVKGNQDIFNRILHILCENAIKYTKYGDIYIGVTEETIDDNKVKIKISVKDTGDGISDDRMELAIKFFAMKYNPGVRRISGSGMGLADANRLASQLNGTTGISSEAGNGSTFWFTAVFDKQPVIEPPITPPESNYRILIVDENEKYRFILNSYLSSLHCVCYEVSNLTQGIQSIKTSIENHQPYHLIFIDDQNFESIEDLSGVKQFMALHKELSLPVIALVRSGLSIIGQSKRFMPNLYKPIQYDKLKSCIENLQYFRNVSTKMPINESIELSNKDNHQPTSESDTQSDLLKEEKVPSATLDSQTELSYNDKHASTIDLQSDKSTNEFSMANLTILIAEDNRINQQVIKQMLLPTGIQVEFAQNGLEVIERLLSHKFDLVLMDVIMPELDGLEATRIIRSKKYPLLDDRIPIIALTANSTQKDIQACVDSGMNGYVSKPFKIKDLEKEIRKCLSEYQSVRDNETICHEEKPSPSENENNQSVNNEQSEEQPLLIPDGPIFNKETLLKRLGGNEELCHEVLYTFVNDMPDRIEKMKAALDQKDMKTLETISHTIKGSSAVIEADALREVASNIEQEAKANNKNQASQFLKTFEHVFELFQNAWNK